MALTKYNEYQINDLISIYRVIEHEDNYDIIFRFKQECPINKNTNEKYRFCMMAISSRDIDNINPYSYLQAYIPARKQLFNEKDMPYQPNSSGFLYDPKTSSSAVLEVIDYINYPSKYQYSDKIKYIKWSDLSYNIKYNFNVGFTDLLGEYTTGYCEQPYIQCRKKGAKATQKNYYEAPILNNPLGAFSETAKNIAIPFETSLSASSLLNMSVQASIISLYTGKSIFKNEVSTKIFPISKDEKKFIIDTEKDLEGGAWIPGIYKISIRLYKNYKNIGHMSEWSTFKVLEYEPDVLIENSFSATTAIEVVENTLNPTFTASYTGPAEEILSQYRFILKENNKQIDDSGWLNHMTSLDTLNGSLNTSINTYCFNKILDPINNYEVIYQGKTVNNYSFEKRYAFKVKAPIYEITNGLKIQENSEEGSIEIYLLDNINLKDGKYRLIRQQLHNTTNSNLESCILRYYNIKELNNNKIIYKDYTIEAKEKYIYKLQFINILGAIENEYAYNNNQPCSVDFEYSYLVGDNVQLKLKFNNNLNNFKYNILQTKQETLGSQYPIIMRNGQAYYAEFPVSGLISLAMDDANNFFELRDDGYYFQNEMVIPHNYYSKICNSNDSVGLNKIYSEKMVNTYNTNLTADNTYIERKFREKVEEFLNNGKPKLFKSPTEGNKIVGLINVSFTPEQKLNRYLYSFNSTAYEVAECNYKNFLQYNIIDINENQELDFYFTNKTNFIHKTLSHSEIFDLSSIQEILNSYPIENSSIGYMLKNVEYIRVENFDIENNAILKLAGNEIQIQPGRAFYVPAIECNNFERFEAAPAGGNITLIITYNLFKRKELKNVGYIGLTGNQFYNNINSPIYFNIKDINDINAINLIDMFHSQILEWNDNSILNWVLNQEKTGYNSQLDEYRIEGFEYLQIINNKATDQNNGSIPIVRINNNNEGIELKTQLFFETNENDLIQNILIEPNENIPMDVIIFAVCRIEYKAMEGVWLDDIVQ